MARSLLVWGLDRKDWTAEKNAIKEHGGILRFWCPTSSHRHFESSTFALLLHTRYVWREGSEPPAQLCRMHK